MNPEAGNPHEFIKPLEKITAADISLDMPPVGGTEIIMQRHEEFVREKDDPNTGDLKPGKGEKAEEQTAEIFRRKLESIPEDERSNVAVLVIGSTTKHFGKGTRSLETAGHVANAVAETLEELGLSEDQVLNRSERIKGDKVRPVDNIQAPRMFDESPEFVKFLRDKYEGEGQGFWVAFEEDTEKETREAMGAEGTFDILDRYKKYMSVLERFARKYHKDNPDNRLIIWTVSHYDTVSPYVKNEITKTDPNAFVGVEYGAGVSVDIDADGNKSSTIQGKRYEF